MVRGYQDREQHQLQILAWMQANLINVHLPRRKRIRPKDLLRREKSRQSKDKKFEQLWAKVERQRRRQSPGGE